MPPSEHLVALAGPTRHPPPLGFCSRSHAAFLVGVSQPLLPGSEHQLVQDAVVFPESHAPGEGGLFLSKRPWQSQVFSPPPHMAAPAPGPGCVGLTAPWRMNAAICPNSLRHISAEQGFLHEDIMPQYFPLFSPGLFMANRPWRYGPFVRESFNDLRVIVLASV